MSNTSDREALNKLKAVWKERVKTPENFVAITGEEAENKEAALEILCVGYSAAFELALEELDAADAASRGDAVMLYNQYMDKAGSRGLDLVVVDDEDEDEDEFPYDRIHPDDR